jgi:hypothetical protein
MLEWGLLSPAYRILRDVWSVVREKQRSLSTAEIVKLRQRWKSEFETKLWERRSKGLRTDVIIRDMKRIDKYPDTSEETKGISPWFRVGLMDTYHRGIQVGLQWDSLHRDADSNRWRHPNRKAGEEGEVKVILIGFIPYENIEAVDWDGDEYYGFPHIYCYFSAKRKEPYERLSYCEQNHLNDIPFYTEVVEYSAVKKS